MAELLGTHRARFAVAGWALAAIGALSFGSLLWEAIQRDGGAAYDLASYVLAGRRVLDGAPLYGPMEINDPGAFRHPPIFAVLAVPLALAPEELVTWAYRAACLGCVRFLVGSWRATGWALLFPPVQIELIALNVTLPIAAVAMAALRGPQASLAVSAIPATAALKFGTALLVPYVWVTRPELRRPLALGAGALVGVITVHALADPTSWAEYLASLGQQAGSANDAPFVGDQLLFLVPSTLGDFLLRLGIGATLVLAAVPRRLDWLAYLAAALAVPTLWVARLSVLVGVPRMLTPVSSSSVPAAGPADAHDATRT